MVLQCPRCPLRFDLAPMLADHLATDHDVSPEDVGHLRPAAARVGRRGDPGRVGRGRVDEADEDGAGHTSIEARRDAAGEGDR